MKFPFKGLIGSRKGARPVKTGQDRAGSLSLSHEMKNVGTIECRFARKASDPTVPRVPSDRFDINS